MDLLRLLRIWCISSGENDAKSLSNFSLFICALANAGKIVKMIPQDNAKSHIIFTNTVCSIESKTARVSDYIPSCRLSMGTTNLAKFSLLVASSV